MASRKRHPRAFGIPRRKRRTRIPLLESLEYRLVLSQGLNPLAPTDSLVGAAGQARLLAAGETLEPFPLAHGGSVWLETPGAFSGSLTPGRQVAPTPVPSTPQAQ